LADDARENVSREMEEVLRQAVSSEPERRFQTAAAFREALDYVTGGC